MNKNLTVDSFVFPFDHFYTHSSIDNYFYMNYKVKTKRKSCIFLS